MPRAAAEIEQVSRMLSSSLALPGPMRAPDSKTMLILTRAMPHCATRGSDFRGVRHKRLPRCGCGADCQDDAGRNASPRIATGAILARLIRGGTDAEYSGCRDR